MRVTCLLVCLGSQRPFSLESGRLVRTPWSLVPDRLGGPPGSPAKTPPGAFGRDWAERLHLDGGAPSPTPPAPRHPAPAPAGTCSGCSPAGKPATLFGSCAFGKGEHPGLQWVGPRSPETKLGRFRSYEMNVVGVPKRVRVPGVPPPAPHHTDLSSVIFPNPWGHCPQELLFQQGVW